MKDRNEFKAGLFMFASLVLCIAIVIAIKGVGRFLEPSHRLSVRFALADDIGGLAPGDQVRVGGAKVGIVRQVRIVDDAPSQSTTARSAPTQHILVDFTIPEHFIVRRDAVVSIQSTITGVSVLNFSTLGISDALGENESLDGHASSWAALMNAAPAVAQVINDVHNVVVPKVATAVDAYHTTADSINGLTGDVRGRVNGIVEHYNSLTETARFAMQQISELFGDTKTDFRTTVANLSASTGAIKEKLPGLLEKTDALMTKVTGAVDSATGAMEDVKVVAANARDVSGSARSIITSNRGKIDGMIASLKTTGDNLKNASAEIRRSPWRLLYKPSANEMANLNLYDSARQFSEGASAMSDAAIALRDALKDPDAKPEQLQKLVDQLDKNFDNFQQVEQKLWSEVKP